MRTAGELQRAVQDELRWEPSIDAAAIGVAAALDGVVTLSGHACSYAEKRAAEKAAKRVRGVRGVANDLVVRLPASAERDDTDIARAALTALEWNTSVPEELVRVSVSNGWITLEGDVDWFFQKEGAYEAVRDLMGVKGVINRIGVKPRVSPSVIREKIEDAFRRSAEIDAKQVWVTIIGNAVTLGGTVRSWTEHENAERAAWSAPGVVEVNNHLKVGAGELAAL